MELTKHPDSYRFVTFNVCGIKHFLSRCAQWVPERSYSAMFERMGADVVCFQETKLQPDGIDKDMALVPGFSSFFSCSMRPRGYSGVSFHVRNSIRVLKAEDGLTGWLTSTPGGTPWRERDSSFGADMYPDISQKEGLEIDVQGRSITLDLGACIVIGLYCPADSSGNMTEYRDIFYQLLDWRVTQFRKAGREVVVLGDLNVAREPIDSATLREALRKAKEPIDDETWKYGSVPRKAVNDWIEQGSFHDTTREAHPRHTTMFTCWDQSKNARPANFGSRIDYVLTSDRIACSRADILPNLMGSDHCPVYADLELSGVEPQGSHRLPMLSRKHTSKWQSGVMSFFTAKPAVKKSADEKPVRKKVEGKPGGVGLKGGASTSEARTEARASEAPTSEARASEAPTSEAPTSEAPTSEAPTSEAPTSEAPTSEAPTSEAPTNEAPGYERPTSRGTAGESSGENSTSGQATTSETARINDASHEAAVSDSQMMTTKNLAPIGAAAAHDEGAECDSSSMASSAAQLSPQISARRTTSPATPGPTQSASKPESPAYSFCPKSPKTPSSPAGGVSKRSSGARQGSLSKLFAAKSTDWARVSERKPPLCMHNEPCELKMSKKPPRKGEYFWHCARPHGGKSNADGKFQCKTFIWASEWRA